MGKRESYLLLVNRGLRTLLMAWLAGKGENSTTRVPTLEFPRAQRRARLQGRESDGVPKKASLFEIPSLQFKERGKSDTVIEDLFLKT